MITELSNTDLYRRLDQCREIILDNEASDTSYDRAVSLYWKLFEEVEKREGWEGF